MSQQRCHSTFAPGHYRYDRHSTWWSSARSSWMFRRVVLVLTLTVGLLPVAPISLVAQSTCDPLFDQIIAQVNQLNAKSGIQPKLLSILRNAKKEYDQGDSADSLALLAEARSLLTTNATKQLTQAERDSILKGIDSIGNCMAAPPLPQIAVYGNRTDVGLVKWTTGDGRVFEFFGNKDESGLATSLNGLAVTLQDGSRAVLIFDESGHLIHVQTHNGLTLRLQWVSDSALLIDGTDGQNEIVSFPVTVASSSLVAGGSVTRETATLNATTTATLLSPAVVNVTQCGAPMSAASVVVNAGSDLLKYPFWATLDSSVAGRYVAQVPVLDPDSGLHAQEKCDAATAAIGRKTCDPKTTKDVNVLCTSIATQLLQNGLPPPSGNAARALGILLTEACVVLVELVAAACFLSSSIAASGACSFLRATIDRFVQEDTVLLQPVATLGSRAIEGKQVEAPALGPFEEMGIAITCLGKYSGGFTAHSISSFGFDHTWTVDATGTVTSDTEGAMSFLVDLASFRVGTNDPPIHVQGSCGVPLTISGNAFSGSAVNCSWLGYMVEVSGMLTGTTMSGQWRLHDLGTVHPGSTDDTGYVNFTLTRDP